MSKLSLYDLIKYVGQVTVEHLVPIWKLALQLDRMAIEATLPFFHLGVV